MYFKSQKVSGLLKVDNFFVTLNSVNDDDDLDFTFSYKISQSQALKQKALAVEVSVYSQILTREKVLTNTVQRGFVNSKKLIGKAVTQVTAAKTTKNEQDNFLMARRRSDITSYVSNSVVAKLASGVDPKNVQELYKKKIKLVDIAELKKSNDDRPVLTYATPSAIYENVDLATSASIEIDAKFHRLEMLNRGIDPSYVAGMTHLSIPAQDAVQGTIRKQKTSDQNFSSQAQLLNSLVFAPDNFRKESTTNVLQHGQMTHVFETETTDEITIGVPVVIPKSRRKLPNGKEVSVVYVEYRLINSKTGEVIDKIIRDLDITKHYQFYMTPKVPPFVQASASSAKSRVNLSIKQQTSNATEIAVYKKYFNKAVTTVDDYTLVGTYRLDNSTKPFTIEVDKPQNSIAVYRIVALGKTGIRGSDYTNVVILPSKTQYKNSFAAVLLPLENGIQIEVTEIPSSVVSIQPVVRNLTTHQKEFTNVSEPILIDDSARTADHISTVDQNVVSDHTYEYAFRLYHRSGTTEVTGNKVLDYISVQPGKISVQLQNVGVIHNPTADVRFDVVFDLGDTTVGILRSILDRDDISKYFDDDIKRERDFLKGLIAHNIQRIDLTTGEREDLGILTGQQFSDLTVSEKNSINPLITSHKYRYEIYTMLRSPETMFETLRKAKVDPLTKKPYVFSPAKFLHPVVLKRGVIVSNAGLKSRFGQDQLMYGSLGLTKTIDVSFDEDPATVVDLSVTRLSKTYNVLSWRLDGNVSLIDHFLIMKEVNGVRTMVGKAHSEFLYGNCTVYHKLSGRDIGELRYVIVPVFNTYDAGPFVKSNAILIED